MPAEQRNLEMSDEETTDGDEMEKVTNSSVATSNLGNASDDDDESFSGVVAPPPPTGVGLNLSGGVAPPAPPRSPLGISGGPEISPTEDAINGEEGENGERRPCAPGAHLMTDHPNDEWILVQNANEVPTPKNSPTKRDGSDGVVPPVPLRSPPEISLREDAINGDDEENEQRRPCVPGAQFMVDDPNDEWVRVPNAKEVPTPRDSPTDHKGSRTVDSPTPMHRRSQDGGLGKDLEDPKQLSSGTAPGGEDDSITNRLGGHRSDGDDDDDDDDENEEDDGSEYRAQGYAGQKPEPMTNMAPEPTVLTNLEYNPSEFAKVNATAPREMQDLFNHILDFRPFVAELPTKLRPFIPDYIPAIGDLEPFVKIPRPDGRADGLGFYVVDEPAIPQSNPAVVLLELRATNVHGSTTATVVDSFEDAANRPEVIDRWIADLKKVHYKKALPTVNYQKPMPEIENLMQVWPQSFEDVLNSDIPFPPPHIDLDMDQYVRTLCAILDIPTYQSLIDSLHVMFTLYEDFRLNQHFQHE